MKTNKLMERLGNSKYKVVKISNDSYTLDNGDVFNHTFDIGDNISLEEFQLLLDNAKETLVNLLKDREDE